MPVDRLERLTNLVTFLLHADQPVTLTEVVEQVPGYPSGSDARRQAFERDKRVLRQERIPVVEEAGRYRIRADDYYLPPLGLTDEERVALQVAVAAVAVSPGDARAGLNKLGGAAVPASSGAAVRAELSTLPDLPVLHDAARARAVLGFSYGDRDRSVEPWGLLFRAGHWYLVGYDRGRDAQRTFRVDRIVGPPSVGPAGAFEPPASFDLAAVPREPWLSGRDRAPGLGHDDDDEVVAEVWVDAVVASGVVARLGDRAEAKRGADGSVVLRLPVTNTEVFRSWLLGLLDHAEVLGPAGLRADVVGWLEAMDR